MSPYRTKSTYQRGRNAKFIPPRSAADFKGLERISRPGQTSVYRVQRGVLAKFGFDHEEEVRVLKFVQGKLSVTTPRVLLHPPFPRSPTYPWDLGKKGVWYYYMDECPGLPLADVMHSLSNAELDHVADQLSTILAEMRSYTSKTLGSVTGGPFNNNFFFPFPFRPKHAFESVGEFLQFFQDMFLTFSGDEYVSDLFSKLPRNAPVHLTHGDLHPRNILVNGSRITAIIDWAYAGFYPEYWEYCRMHHPNWRTPAWDYILARVFPGPRREEEIAAVVRIGGDIVINCYTC